MSTAKFGVPIENVANIHPPGQCAGAYCPVHSNSDHPFADERLFFNGVHMLRVSPDFDHGAIVDPDDYLLNQNGSAILVNSAQCRTCGDVVTSTSRHDFVMCSCKSVFVDGGFSYIRRGGDPENIKDLSVFFDLFTINDRFSAHQRYVLVQSVAGDEQKIIVSATRSLEG